MSRMSDLSCVLYHNAHAPNSETTGEYTRQYDFFVLHLQSKKININQKRKVVIK